MGMSDKKLSLLAGLFAIRCNPTMQTGTFVYDSAGVEGGSYKINWLDAEENLRAMAVLQTETSLLGHDSDIKNLPTAEWIISSESSDGTYTSKCECSNCCFDNVKTVLEDGKPVTKPNLTPYCPECGAHMFFNTLEPKE